VEERERKVLIIGVGSELQELGHQGLTLIIATPGYHNLCAFLRKHDCGCPTNAGQCAGNQHNW
jgi:hypothetical protein